MIPVADPNQQPSGNPASHTVDLAVREVELFDAAWRRGAPRVPSSCEPGRLPTATAPSGLAAPPPADHHPWPEIPGYMLVHEIHRGGQGVVYHAIQESTQRDVAIKLLHRAGAARPRDRQRFELEAQVLRELNHPGILPVLDMGEIDGRQYLVMRYVESVPVDRHVTETGLGVRETLELTARICDVVGAAHLSGVIHRDIKPGNILIDNADTPFVVDFGLAKLVKPDDAPPAGESGGHTLTEPGQFVGSLPWASPEQAEGLPGTIDVRTDVYSLGAVLYYLLTGRDPIDPSGSQRDVLNRIVTAEPPPPSATLNESRSGASRLSAGRFAYPLTRLPFVPSWLRASVRSPISSDIDTLVMKCLAKDPVRRYSTAGDLAADIRRYLAGEPIEAKRDSRWYVLRKALRRHRAAVAVAAAFLILLTGGTVVSTVLWQRAEQRRIEAVQAQGREREQREVAEKREKETQQVSEFQGAMLRGIDVEAMGRGIKDRFREQVRAALERQYVGEGADRRKRTPEDIEAEMAAFDQLTGAAQAPDVARGVMDEFVLARAADALEKQFANQPLVQAQLHAAIGDTYNGLGLHNAAETHFRKALEIRQRELGEVHELVAYSLHDLGGLWIDRGDHAAGEPLLRQVLALYRRLHGDECEHVADALSNLAQVMSRKGDGAEAERLNRESLAIRRKLLGDQHPGVASGMAELAMVLSARDHAAAESLYREALAIARNANDDQSLLIARILNDLGVMFWTRDAAEAERLLREALAIKRARAGDEHPDIAMTLHDLGSLLLEKGDYAAAEPPLREVLAIRRKLFGDQHPDVAMDLATLAELLWRKRDYASAEPLYRESLAILRLSDHPNLAWTLHHLADCLLARGALEEAEQLAREAVDIYRVKADRSPVERGEHRHATDVLSHVVVVMGKVDDAISIRRQLVEDCRRLSPDGPSLDRALAPLGMLLVQQGRYAEAEPVLREVVEIREKALKPDSPGYWLLANARSMLGGALAGQGAALIESDTPAAIAKFTEAEPLLVEAGGWLTQNADRIPQQFRAARVREALERIVTLYESWDTVAPDSGKAEQAAEWRDQLAELQGPQIDESTDGG
jgi:serine/threonine protein kinase